VGKLNNLAKAAAEFYEVPFEKLKSPCREAVCTKPRHNCHWIASDADIPRSTIAKYWGVDRTSILYGIRMVNKRIKNNYEKEELRRFLFFLRENLK